MSLATVVQGSATRALNLYGQAATLNRSVPGVFDPVTGTTTATVSTYPVKALIDSASLRTLGYKFGDGLVQSGDVLATFSAKGIPFDPMPGDTLTVGSIVFALVITRPVYVGSSAVIHECVVRR